LRRRLLRADTVTVALIGAESSPGRTRAWPVVRPRGSFRCGPGSGWDGHDRRVFGGL